jgi:hypothetical protein
MPRRISRTKGNARTKKTRRTVRRAGVRRRTATMSRRVTRMQGTPRRKRNVTVTRRGRVRPRQSGDERRSFSERVRKMFR